MSYPAESELGQQAGGGLKEPCWAAEAQTGTTSWRDEDLDLESFASGHKPYDTVRGDPSTPMAEEIATSSRYHPPLGASGQRVGASLTPSSDSEAEPVKKGPSQLPPDRRASEDSWNLVSATIPELSKLSQEYFPLAQQLKAPSRLQSPMEPPAQFAAHIEAVPPLNVPKVVEDKISDSKAKKDGREAKSVAWVEVRNLREEILGLRSRVHQKRDELKRMDMIKAEADNLLFRRMLLEGKGIHLEERTLLNGQKTLQQLMDDCQKARDDYGPKEADCTALEDQMSRLEFRLNCLEEPFFNRIEQPQTPLPTTYRHIVPGFQDFDTGSTFLTDDKSEEPDFHPSVMIYLSKLGDLDLLHERRDILVEEKLALEEEKEKRSGLGMTLNPDDQAWLTGSQAEYDSLVKDITVLEAELVQLREDCINQEFLGEYGEPIDFANREAAAFHDEDDLNPEDQVSQYVKHPHLLPLYLGRKNEKLHVYDTKSEPDETSENPMRRINSWMLRSLRMSALNVNCLASIFEARGGQPSTQWENAVIEFWFTDIPLPPTAQALRSYASSLVTETDLPNSSTQKQDDSSHFGSYFDSFQKSNLDPIVHTEPLFKVVD